MQRAVLDRDGVEAHVDDATVEADAVDRVAVEVDRDAARADDQAVARAVDEVCRQLDALHEYLTAGRLALDRSRPHAPRPRRLPADAVDRTHGERVRAGGERG